MKKIHLIGALAIGLSGAAFAQNSTNNAVTNAAASTQNATSAAMNAAATGNPTVSTWLQSAEAYFTSFNTNSTTFESHNLRVFTGPDYQSQINVDAAVGAQYRVWNSESATINVAATGLGLGLESVVRNAGIAGTLDSAQAGAGLMVDKYDVEISAWVDGGYSPYKDSAFAAGAAQVSKAATANTFVGVRLETQFFSKTPGQPLVGVFVGATF
jgi:hypothetical protein